MIGTSRLSTAISAHDFYPQNASKTMPKRKQLDLVSESDDSCSSGAVFEPITTKRRRVSRRLQDAKEEEERNIEVKVEIKAEPPMDEDSDSEIIENSGVSAYEKMRLKNIEDNAKFFASLDIFKAKEDLSIASGSSVKKSPSSRGLKREKRVTEVLPRRPLSLRLQRIDPAGSPLPPLPELVEEPVNRYERKPSEPIEMIPINQSEDSKEKSSTNILNMMSGKVKSPKPSSAKQTADLQTFSKALSKMRIIPERVAKVTKDRIFSVAIHPSENKVLACAGDKWGKIGLWDVESKDDNDNGVYLFEPHSRPVNCLHFAPANPTKIYSTSYDGTVRCGDFEMGVFDEVYATPEDENTWTNGFDFLSPDGTQLLVSENNRGGYIAVVDTRSRSSPKNVYHVHGKSTKTVSIHPLRKHYFVTASNDATVALWDMRSMKESGMCKPITSLPHVKGVTAAYFSPITGAKILTTSNDDRIRVFNCIDSGDIVTGAEIQTTIRHNNHVGRWLTTFRATWHPMREDVFVSGSMSRPRQIEVFDDKGALLKNFMDEDCLGSVCSLNVFHPTRNILVGGNSSGRLHVFM